jgi:hypothetical protein
MSANTVDATIAARRDAQTGHSYMTAVMANAYPPMAMKPAWPKLSRPVNPKWMTRPTVASAYAAVVGEKISPIARKMKLEFMRG